MNDGQKFNPSCPQDASRRRLAIFVLLVVCLAGLIASGCRSARKPASARFAAVELQGNTPGQIRKVAAEVFRTNGYKVVTTGLTNLIFEKEGTTMNNVAYGNWMGGTPVWVRVKGEIVPVSEGIFRLQCHAYMVRDKGSAAFEEETQLSNFRRRPYQRLLDQVAMRLKSGP